MKQNDINFIKEYIEYQSHENSFGGFYITEDEKTKLSEICGESLERINQIIGEYKMSGDFIDLCQLEKDDSEVKEILTTFRAYAAIAGNTVQWALFINTEKKLKKCLKKNYSSKGHISLFEYCKRNEIIVFGPDSKKIMN